MSGASDVPLFLYTGLKNYIAKIEILYQVIMNTINIFNS